MGAQSGNVSKNEYNQQRVSSSSVDRILKKELHQFGYEEEDSDPELHYSPIKMTKKQIQRISQKVELLPKIEAGKKESRKLTYDLDDKIIVEESEGKTNGSAGDGRVDTIEKAMKDFDK